MVGNVQAVSIVNASASAESVVAASLIANGFRLDARQSTRNGLPLGSQDGLHSWVLSADSLQLDLSDAGVPLTIQNGVNTALNAAGFWEKNIAGNVWNSQINSVESFDPLTQDFFISAPVWVGGTIRQMLGLDDIPSGAATNQEYKSPELSIYEYNATVFRSVYESGAAVVTGRGDVAVIVGDRRAIRCVGGVFTYFIIRADGSIDDIYQSTKSPVVPLFFKGSFNRGVGSSGHSKMTDIRSHTLMKVVPVSVSIQGAAMALISDQHKAVLESVGLVPVAGAMYSDLKLERVEGINFPASLQHEFNHSYVVPETQSTGII